jgi:hypothetical protein
MAGNSLLTLIINPKSNHIVFVVRNGECPLQIVVLVDKVGNDKGRATLLNRVGKVLQRLSDVGAVVYRFEIDQLADYPQNMASAFFRRNEFLDGIGERKSPRFCRYSEWPKKPDTAANSVITLLFEFIESPEIARATNVDNQHNGQFALLFKYFHERGGCTGP